MQLVSHGTTFLFKAHLAHAQYFIKQFKCLLFNFLKELPIIQNIIPEYLAQAYPRAILARGVPHKSMVLSSKILSSPAENQHQS